MIWAPTRQGISITLTLGEYIGGIAIGLARQIGAVTLKLPSNCTVEVDIPRHINGACAEVAVAKFLGLYWPMGVNVFKAPDIGEHTEVKRSYITTDKVHLIVDEDKLDDRKDFVFVTGTLPNFVIRGWLAGAMVCQEKYRRVGADGKVAYWVPLADLRKDYVNLRDVQELLARWSQS